MNYSTDNRLSTPQLKNGLIAIIIAMIVVIFSPIEAMGQSAVKRHHKGHQPTQTSQSLPLDSVQSILPDSIAVSRQVSDRSAVVVDSFALVGDSMIITPVDTIGILTAGEAYAADSIQRRHRNESIMKKLSNIPEEEWVPRAVEFNPDPTRAVWLSALFPGLGQVYNRRYWKLPIIVGGYLGLGYATSWNNQMLTDYTRAYADLLDNDPTSKSYMDFFAPNVKESDVDKAWLKNLLKSRKNYFRRNRDLCIISMVGVYLLAMVDAYVDASLSHFDINPHLSMDVVPALMQDGRQKYPSVGLAWALNF